jgi:hypothetical protein
MSHTLCVTIPKPATIDDVLRNPHEWSIVGVEGDSVIYSDERGRIVREPVAPTAKGASDAQP